MLDHLNLHTGTDLKCFTLPVFHDWSAEDVWNLIKPHLYEEEGRLQMHRLDREPDGEPVGWTNVVVKDERDYLPISECHCETVPDVGMCKHWREVR